ncbi:uncharacterized protein LOC136087076 [Hydra vulgaris]|uniref:Uncharacterized protein LOC136087076 n=1 Tax=Hydra vulgaris TaxID=6087 RepID=A0ABM4CUM9_HYDVU
MLLPPAYRSSLQAIQLLCLAKLCEIRKFGVTSLLEDLKSAINILKNGVVIKTSKGEKLIYGSLLFVLVNTLAAQNVGGFKEDEQERLDRVQELLLRTGRKKDAVYWSKKYGVNGDIMLANIPYFKLTKCLLHDPMYILLEGIIRFELRCMLKKFIFDKKYFKLDSLNRQLKQFPYSRREAADKPQLITVKDIESGGLRGQSAASTLTLINVLPFIIGVYIPEDDASWMNFFNLLKITLLCLSPMANENTANSLRCLIGTYNKNFVQIYSEESFIPKMQYLVHLPDQLFMFGPLQNYWCMRCEGKHALFKQQRFFNFKGLYKRGIVNKGYQIAQIHCDNSIPVLEFGLNLNVIPKDIELLASTSVTINGHEYAKDIVIVLSLRDDDIEFCPIDAIVVVNYNKYFI